MGSHSPYFCDNQYLIKKQNCQAMCMLLPLPFWPPLTVSIPTSATVTSATTTTTGTADKKKSTTSKITIVTKEQKMMTITMMRRRCLEGEDWGFMAFFLWRQPPLLVTKTFSCFKN